jgi:hypothetical protein
MKKEIVVNGLTVQYKIFAETTVIRTQVCQFVASGINLTLSLLKGDLIYFTLISFE